MFFKMSVFLMKIDNFNAYYAARSPFISNLIKCTYLNICWVTRFKRKCSESPERQGHAELIIMFLYVCYITRNDILWRPESFLSITEDYISTIEFDCNDILSFLLFSKHPFTLSSLETFLYVRNGSFQNWVTDMR